MTSSKIILFSAISFLITGKVDPLILSKTDFPLAKRNKFIFFILTDN